MKYLVVTTLRNSATVLVTTLILVPLALVTLLSIENFLASYPTIRLIGLIGITNGVVFLITKLTPLIVKIVTRYIFPRSFNYYEELETVAYEFINIVDLSNLPQRYSVRLSKLLGCSVEILDNLNNIRSKKRQTKDQLFFIVAEQPIIALWFGPKNNGELWVVKDKAALQNLVAQTGAMLTLAKQKRAEEVRHRQVQEILHRSTADLIELHNRLKARDPQDRLHFDQLAHDLKNPVIVLSFILQEPETSGPAFELLRIDIAWMTKFIDHVLELSRSGAGKVTPKFESTDVAATIEEVIYELDAFATSQGQKVAFASPDEPVMAVVDPFLFYRLLLLLMVRAIRLTRSGIVLELHYDIHGLLLNIIMSPMEERAGKRMQQLLETIKQQRPSQDDRRAGITGLELHLANWIIENHRGKLMISEADASRTVFSVSIPILNASGKL